MKDFAPFLKLLLVGILTENVSFLCDAGSVTLTKCDDICGVAKEPTFGSDSSKDHHSKSLSFSLYIG
jgi:hypothetical protein